MTVREEHLDSTYIFPLTGVGRAEPFLVGGKGYHLHRLVEGNFHVPGGFVITTRAFREVMALVVASHPPVTPEGLRQRILDEPLPQAMEEAILTAAARLRSLAGLALVVRSSATLEDRLDCSMAGLNATYLNVRTSRQLMDAVRGCWASLFGPESLAYRLSVDHDPAALGMAVVVQQLIPAHRAGVLFTVDPVHQDPTRMWVNASWGLGETVVGGKEADNYVIDRSTGRIIEETVVRKRRMAVPGREGLTVEVPVLPEEVRKSVVDAVLARQLADLGVRVERMIGGPQDLEWAEWEDRIYLLQTRPVSGARRQRPAIWTNANVGEALPGVATPYTWAVIREFSKKGLVHAFQGLGCRVPEEYTIVGSIHGRVYLNISEFMAVASQIPFLTPAMMQQVAGGGGGAEESQGTYRKMGQGRFLALLPVTVGRLLAERALFASKVALFADHYSRVRNRLSALNLAALSDGALASVHEEAKALFDETGTLLMECSGQFLGAYLATTMIIRRLAGDSAEALESRVFSGLSGVTSAEPGLDLLRMARRVLATPRLAKVVSKTPTEDLLEVLGRGGSEEKGLLLAFEAFLAHHGHRATREAELSNPRWREDPSFPLSVLQRHVQAAALPDPDALVEDRVRVREEATRQVESLLPRGLVSLFRRLLTSSQRGARTREDLRSRVVENIGFYRTLALETARRMVARGVLMELRDGFFLTREEHLSFLSGTLGAEASVRALLRRIEYQAQCQLPDPPGIVAMESGRIRSANARPVEGWVLSGIAGSPGVATGRVVVARDPSEASTVSRGDILVAPFTDVGWTPLFLVAGGVVTELGGPLSHSCVVAREYGVPAVVSVRQATSLLKTGQRVTVDGTRGQVTVESP
jgi:pyruvate,water dikinase